MVSAKSLTWAGWTKTEKPFDRDRPFHRIKSPVMKEEELLQEGESEEARRERADKLRASGLCYDKELPNPCRIPTEIPFATLTEQTLADLEKVLPETFRDPRNIIRTVPSWVLVENEQLREVEGLLLRSYQTWTDFPLFQWHRWYDWNFFISPAPGYGFLRGGANKPPFLDPNASAVKNGFTQIAIRDFDGEGAETMECEFDCGLFGSRFRDPPNGIPQSFGPMFEDDLAWPLAGQYFWGIGRWIYDCAHPTSDFRTEKEVEEAKQAGNANAALGMARSELHPCRGVATARWEAFRFPENGDLFVPAIQFMFFLSRFGGYTDAERQSRLLKEDVEFIVDLPKPAPSPEAYPIGHTPDFAQNTIVLGPRLLTQADFGPFERAIRKTAPPQFTPTSSRVEPTVKPIRPEDPNSPPEQVIVTIPLSAVPDTDDFYGVILSMGWLDRDFVEAKRVKKVKVTVDKIEVGSERHDAPVISGIFGEWQLRVGVNGRWKQKRDDFVSAGGEILLDDRTVEFHLAEEDSVQLTAHGEETDRVHDTYKDKDDEDRVLQLPTLQIPVPIIGPITLETRDVKYFQDCIDGDLKLARKIVTAIEDDQFFTFGVENDPLGRIDPFHVVDTADTKNPLPVKDLIGTIKGRQSALLSKEVGKSAELAEKAGALDYRVRYTVEITPQIKET